MSISSKLRIFKDYKSYDEIPRAKKAWITIKANKAGLDPVMVHAGVKAAFARKKKRDKRKALVNRIYHGGCCYSEDE